MKIKCNKCKKDLDIKITKLEVVSYKNALLDEDEILIKLHHQTFCRECGELVVGVIRKILSYKDIVRLIQDNSYGVK